MNHLMKLKRIIGVICFTFVLLIIGSTVHAYEYCKYTDAEDKTVKISALSQTVLDRYGISISQGSDSHHFNVTMNPEPALNGFNHCDISFKLVKVNGTDIDSDSQPELSCTNSIENYYVANTNYSLNSGLDGAVFEFKPQQDIPGYEKDVNTCYYTKEDVFIDTEMSVTLATEPYSYTCENVPVSPKEVTVGGIDCINWSTRYGKDEFKYLFCQVKEKSANTERDFSTSITSAKYNGSTQSFKCSTDVHKIPKKTDDLKGDKYFVNKDYRYAKAVVEEHSIDYYAHYSPDVATKVGGTSCKLECEEAVEVEYGPPVAVQAGLCFEYNVRVTSRVSCYIKDKPEPYKCECNYCTPTPSCVGQYGQYQQGGPNEEFDSCVKACDGGKYTNKCSNKCYKQVYGSKAIPQAKINNSFLNSSATKLAEYTPTSSGAHPDGYKMTDVIDQAAYYDGKTIYGIYAWSGSSIQWYDSGIPHDHDCAVNHPATGEGRWYTEHACGGRYHNEYKYNVVNLPGSAKGFWRQWKGSFYCNDTCKWQPCGSSYYLNPGSGAQDCYDNTVEYNNLVDRCSAKAKCSTEVSEYTISASYTKLDGTTRTIGFPGPEESDQSITSFNVSNPDKINIGLNINTAKSDNTTIKINYPKNRDGVWGCYDEYGTNTELYRTTWGFPGSWIEKKYSGVVYKKPTPTTNGYIEHSGQFCVPGDARDTNAVWWNQWYKYKSSDNDKAEDISTSSVYSWNDDKIKDQCWTKTSGEGWSITNIDINKSYKDLDGAPDIDWNILAKAKKFGFFKWPIEIQCFFAINSDPSCTGDCCLDPSKCYEKKDDSWSNTKAQCIDKPYVRPVDNTELFPAESGNGERIPGYNWSEYSINQKKNTNYQSNPVKYKEQVKQITEQSENGLYDDKYLDYEFVIMPDKLRKIRKNTLEESKKFTNWDTDGFIDSAKSPNSNNSGITHYYSEYVRNNVTSYKAPERGSASLYCNNMINYSNTSVCNDIHNES